MPDLTYRQQKIQEKRKQTPWREFVMEICSWLPLNIYKVDWILTRYPDTNRKGIVINDPYVSRNNDCIGEYSGNFFVDYQKFYDASKKSNLITTQHNENTNFADQVYGAKNGYLSFAFGFNVENILYSIYVVEYCRNVMNSISITHHSDNVFESKNIRQSFSIFYSANVNNSSDLRFCRDMIGCHHCIDCEWLENKSYCINNQQLSKEEYQIKKEELFKQKSSFLKVKNAVFSNMGNSNAIQSTGTGIVNASDITNGYLVLNAKDCRNVILLEGGETGSSELYDWIDVGINSTHCYACCGVGPAEHFYCGIFSGDHCTNCFYCMGIGNCSFCLWCIGLKNKSYCIFNKQYTKEERYEKVDEIFTQMCTPYGATGEKDWTLWQFFPATMNPFYFNDTAAYLIDPTFTKEEVEAAGYLRRDDPIKVDIPADLEQVKVANLDQYEGFNSEGKRTINPNILKKVIIDEAGNARRIVKMEYDFLIKYALPLPRKHRLDRMKENFKIG